MKNLINEKPEIIDGFPHRTKIRPRGIWFRHGEDYPWKKVHRFFTSRIGHNWDDVFSEYTHLDWIPKQYKNEGQITNIVVLNTFLKNDNDNVWFFDRWGFHSGEKLINNYISEIFYVHPTTKILCHHNPKKIDYRKKYKEENIKTLRVLGDYHQLLKLDGIWYEVKGKKVNSFTIHSLIEKKGPEDRLICDNPEKFYFCRDSKKLSYVEIVVKRQLSSKELKKHGVINDKFVSQKRCSVCGNLKCINLHHKGNL